MQKKPVVAIVDDDESACEGTMDLLKAMGFTAKGSRSAEDFLQSSHFRCTASSKDPARASIVGTHTYVLKQEEGTVKVCAESTIRATATAFHITINLTILRNGKPFFQKMWTATERRELL